MAPRKKRKKRVVKATEVTSPTVTPTEGQPTPAVPSISAPPVLPKGDKKEKLSPAPHLYLVRIQGAKGTHKVTKGFGPSGRPSVTTIEDGCTYDEEQVEYVNE